MFCRALTWGSGRMVAGKSMWVSLGHLALEVGAGERCKCS